MSEATPSPPDPVDLRQAFSLFNQASEQLTGVYQDLQKQVGQLTQELAITNGELRFQLAEKETLSQRLALLLAALPGGIVVLDAEGMITETNPGAVDLLGEPLIGQSWVQILQRALTATGLPGEWWAGQRRLNISTRQMQKSGGEILLLQDITQAHQVQEQLQRHQRLSAMGEMVAGLAHQLRTPLAAALLYTSHLRGELTEDDRTRFADKALARLRTLERLIQDMLIFVRGGKLSQETFSVSMLLTDIQQVIGPQMAQQSLRFEVHYDTEDALLHGSREAICGALLNLLSNAIEACQPHGHIKLTARNEGTMVAFRVSDSGKGIPPELQERLFEPFFTTRTEGTGLGLAIVREVTQAHGGEISVTSTLGVGSEFLLRLPIHTPMTEPL